MPPAPARMHTAPVFSIMATAAFSNCHLAAPREQIRDGRVAMMENTGAVCMRAGARQFSAKTMARESERPAASSLPMRPAGRQLSGISSCQLLRINCWSLGRPGYAGLTTPPLTLQPPTPTRRGLL